MMEDCAGCTGQPNRGNVLNLEPTGPTSPRDVIEIGYRGGRYRFVLPEQPDYIVNTIASMRTFYEVEMLEDIRRRVRPKELVLDIGAHVGNHTIYLAGVCGCEVLAFEPFQENFAILNANIALNGLGAQVKSLPIALGASVGRGVARLKDEQNRGSVVIDEVSGASGIPIKPLDEIELPRDPALLKIDVEGAEFEVLEGAQSLLRRCRPLLYLETIDDDAFETAVRFLDGFGYQALACFNVTPTFLFATTDDARIGADERRLDRIFGRSCIRHRADLEELSLKVRETRRDLSELRRRLEDSQIQLSETHEKLQRTADALRRTRRRLTKVIRMARQRKPGPVDQIRRTLATTTLLPGPIRRLFARHLASRRLRRPADTRVRQPRHAISGSGRAVPPGSQNIARGVVPAASSAKQTQPPADEINPPSTDLTFRAFFGLRLAFADRVLKKLDPLDGKRYIFIGNPRKLFDAPDPKSCLLDHYGIRSVADSVVGMTSSNGGWYRAVARLKSLGVDSFVIMLDPERNESLVAKRIAIQINAIRTIFIPNYKCGYASFRQFCFDNFEEFESCDRENSSSLNRFIDFSNRDGVRYFVFSIIRHPARRFKSLYFDKFCRPGNQVNTSSFLAPFRLLLEKSEITPDDVLDVVAEIPDEYSDAHWKSQYYNTTHRGQTLVDHYVRMEQIEKDFQVLSEKLRFSFDLPRTLSTAEISRSHKHNLHFERATFREKLERRYPDDFLKLDYS